MATVYEAYEAAPLERVVALKVLPPEFLHDEKFATRFTQEARIAALLEHPSIVPVYASGVDDGIPWMSMRLLNGGSLADLLTLSPDGLGIERTITILRGIAEALDYAHARGVVHRDVKSSNILLDEADRPYVGDFGLAHLLESRERLTQSRMLMGTPHYMAPEQGRGLTVDHRCDIYSLGIVAYEMLTGTTPFRGRSAAAILMQHERDPVPVPARTLVTEAQFIVLKKALAKQREERWQTATEFVDALEMGVPASQPHPRAGLASVVVRWAWVGAAAASFVLLLVWSAATLDPSLDLPTPIAPPPSADLAVPPSVGAPVPPRAEIDVIPGGRRPSLRESTRPPLGATTGGVGTAPTDAPAPVVSPPSATQETGTTPPVAERPPAEISVSEPIVSAPAVETPVGEVITQPERIGTLNPVYPLDRTRGPDPGRCAPGGRDSA